jgi:spore maturation protein CgeB
MLAKIAFYIERPEERQRIARASQARVRAEDTLLQRAERLLAALRDRLRLTPSLSRTGEEERQPVTAPR